jgi:hypothetical protein
VSPEQIFAQLIVPEGYLSPSTSIVIAYVVLGALPLALVLLAQLAALRLRWRASRADASCRPDASITPGDVTLCGVVDRDDDESPAIRVELEQQGAELKEKTGWTVTWSEIATNRVTGEALRRVRSRPFYLRLDSGQRLRVEPGSELRLADALDGTTQLAPDRRLRFAELTEGERVFIHGRIAPGVDPEAADRGYRGGGPNLVLGPPARGPMLFSSEGLGDSWRRKARARRLGCVMPLLLVVALQLAISSYHLRLLRGRDDRATVTALHIIKKSKSRSYHVVAEVSSGGKVVRIDDDLGLDQWRLLQVGTAIPVRFVESSPTATTTGHGARLPAALIIAPAPMLVLSLLLYVVLVRRAIPWYERARFDEKKDGRLSRGKPARDD